jgi:hypothetical protein
MFIPTLPPAVTRLVLFFCLAAPVIAAAVPVTPADAPSKLQPRQPQVSRRMGQRRSKVKEMPKKKDYSQFLCPGGSVACPIPPSSLSDITPASIETLTESLTSLGDWFKVGFECIEMETELNSCGGCLALGSG